MTIALPWPFNHSCSLVADDEDDHFSVMSVKEPVSLSLVHYSTPGKSPPSARVDPKLKIRQRRPVRPWHLWKYGLVAAYKGKF